MVAASQMPWFDSELSEGVRANFSEIKNRETEKISSDNEQIMHHRQRASGQKPFIIVN